MEKRSRAISKVKGKRANRGSQRGGSLRSKNLYTDPSYRRISARSKSNSHSHFFNLVGLYLSCIKLTIVWTVITIFTQT
jgi:hypothetical protein